MLFALFAFGVACGVFSRAGTDAAAAPEANGAARILYASDAAYPANQIYVADPTGRKPIGRLTFGKAPPCRRWIGNWCGWDAPEPSPDGRKVAMWFRHHDQIETPDSATLYVSRAYGRGRIPIERNVRLSRFDDPFVRWSPDSRFVAYWSDAEYWRVFRADGKGRAFNTPQAWWPKPGSSPDSRWRLTTGDKSFALTDTRQDKRRTVSIWAMSWTWTADSRRLAFAGVEGGIYLLNTRSQSIERLTVDHGRDLDWSPDGRSIAYVSSGDLRVANLSGRVKTVVDDTDEFGGVISSLAWTRPPRGTAYRKPPPRFPVGDGTATLPWDIERIATDGGRVALIACGHVFAWSPARREVVQADDSSLTQRCNSPEFYSPVRMYDVGIAGDRVGWGYHQGNTGQQAELFVTALEDRRRSTLSLGDGWGILGCPWQSPLGELAGSAGLLVYSTWDERGDPPGYCSRIATEEQSIRRVPEGGCPCPVLRSEPGRFVPFDVDSGRIVAAGDNALILLDSSGTELLSIPVRAASASLAGDDLVVLVQGALRHLDARTGALLHTWPLPNVSIGERCATPNIALCRDPALVLEDAAQGLVTYVIEKQVHVLRLEDGSDVVVAPGQSSGFVDTGLVVAVGPQLRLVRFDELRLPRASRQRPPLPSRARA